MVVAVGLTASTTRAQTTFALLADGEMQAWEASQAWTVDSLDAAARDALGWLAADGYALARIDSASTRSLPPDSARITLYVRRGARLPVASLALDGLAHLDEAAVRALFDTRPGAPLDAAVLRADLARLVDRYAAEGYGLAQVTVTHLDLTFDDAGTPAGIALALRVDEGAAVVLRGVEMGEGVRTRSGYAARLMGLRVGEPLRVFDPAAFQERLEKTRLFTRVGLPQVLLDGQNGATLRLDVEEAPPGAFDLVLGLQPGAAGESATFVGTGHLLLQNLFGTGQLYELQLNRLPGQVSRLFARASVPFVLGLPLRLDARFDGTQQDSAYGAQQYRGSAAIGGVGREVLLTVSREAVKPGVGGARVQNGRQRVARSSATFVGIGFHLSDLDVPYNPRRGYVWETLLEHGTRQRTRTVEDNGTLVRERTATRQERLTTQARLYRPLARRVVGAAGLDGYALLSDAYEESELFRLGGATTLRGYDEDRFRPRYAARGFAEVRLLLDRLSYAFLFADVAYLDQPEATGVSSLRGVYPGYGLGVQVSTGVGLVVATYAASPESGWASGRIHLGLSFGL